MVDITAQVNSAIEECNLREGAVLVYVPHTTAAVTVNEGADTDVQTDIIGKLARLIPHRDGYDHLEGNSDAHIKSSLIGVDEMIPVKDSRLVLGTWQKVFFCEFDGPRTRRFHVVPIDGGVA